MNNENTSNTGDTIVKDIQKIKNVNVWNDKICNDNWTVNSSSTIGPLQSPTSTIGGGYGTIWTGTNTSSTIANPVGVSPPHLQEMMAKDEFKIGEEVLDLSSFEFVSILSFQEFASTLINNSIESFTVYVVKFKINEKEYINKISYQPGPEVFFFLPQAVSLPDNKRDEFIELIVRHSQFIKIKKFIDVRNIKSFDEDMIEEIIK